MPFSRVVLLIDARRKDREIYRSYLEQDDRYCYRFIEVSSISAGLALCHSQKPDLVLLDFEMPDGDGLEFLNQWRLRFGRDPAPIIMLTEKSNERLAVQAIKSGAQDYLVKKQLGPQELCRCAHQVMERISLLHDLQQQQAQQQLLGNIALRIRQAVHLQDMLEMVVPEVRAYLQADRVLVYQLTTLGKGSVVAESVVANYERTIALQIEEPCFEGPLRGSYQRGHLSLVSNVQQAVLHPCHRALLDRFQVQAYLVAPIVVSQDENNADSIGHLWGLLVAHQCSGPRSWSKWDSQLLEQLSTHLAIAIRQAELLQNLRTLNARLEETVQERTAQLQERTAQLQESNRQLTQTNADLARATRLKNEFLANMSHELRTPLNAILGMATGLQESVFGSLDNRQQEALETIVHNGQHLLGLINNLLDLAKLEVDALEITPYPVSVSQLCRSSLAQVRQAALQRQIQLKLSLQGTFPALIADEQRMQQVLTNLLNNAIKFTPEGGSVLLRVYRESLPTIEGADPNKSDPKQPLTPWISFSVTDTGIGIAPENLGQLFQSFTQIDGSLSRQYGGAGLGLALVRHIVELHGGQIEVKSNLGQGSCFIVRLPDMEQPYRSAVAIPELDRMPPESIGLTAVYDPLTPNPEPALILLAEDDQANVDTISSYLESRGYRLLLANRGKVAITLAQSHHPNLILLDTAMPDMAGREAIQQIRQTPEIAAVPIIALRDAPETVDADSSVADGANEYLTKPVRLKQLAITIQKLLTAKR